MSGYNLRLMSFDGALIEPTKRWGEELGKKAE